MDSALEVHVSLNIYNPWVGSDQNFDHLTDVTEIWATPRESIFVLHLTRIKSIATNNNVNRNWDFLHLNSKKFKLHSRAVRLTGGAEDGKITPKESLILAAVTNHKKGRLRELKAGGSILSVSCQYQNVKWIKEIKLSYTIKKQLKEINALHSSYLVRAKGLTTWWLNIQDNINNNKNSLTQPYHLSSLF